MSERMVKLQSLAKFPVDHLFYPVLFAPVFLLCNFASFAYFAINCSSLSLSLSLPLFIPPPTPPHSILQSITNSKFDIISSYSLIL